MKPHLNMTILSSKTMYKNLFYFQCTHKFPQYKIRHFLSFIFLKKEETRRRRKNTYWINYEWCVVDVVVSLDAEAALVPLIPLITLPLSWRILASTWAVDLSLVHIRSWMRSLGRSRLRRREEQAAAERPKNEKHKPRFLFLSMRFLLLSTRVQQETFLPSPDYDPSLTLISTRPWSARQRRYEFSVFNYLFY